MKLVEPYVKAIDNKSIDELIEYAARICYASAPKEGVDTEKFLNGMWKNGHRSPFRHGTHYYKVVIGTKDLLWIQHNAYVHYRVVGQYVFFCLNDQYYREHKIIWPFDHYEISEDEFFINCDIHPELFDLLRVTFEVQTQISTTREFNRISPNNICEQSTRYCNYSKGKFDSQIAICKPHWFDVLSEEDKARVMLDWEVCESAYMDFLEKMPPQDAREFLPLATRTIAIYTYTVKEWKHFLDLRYKGITGPPHPNIKILATEIYNYLNNYGYLKNYE